MLIEELIQLEDARWKNERVNLLRRKGGSYSGNVDTLANFKRLALLTRTTPEQVLGIYAAKHWDAIQTWIINKQESEPIEERIDDLQNYLALLRGLITEANRILPDEPEFVWRETISEEEWHKRRNGNDHVIAKSST